MQYFVFADWEDIHPFLIGMALENSTRAEQVLRSGRQCELEQDMLVINKGYLECFLILHA